MNEKYSIEAMEIINELLKCIEQDLSKLSGTQYEMHHLIENKEITVSIRKKVLNGKEVYFENIDKVFKFI